MTDRILVTGAAGFIGFHLTEALLRAGYSVLGLDSLNAYYDPRLKHARLEILRQHESFEFVGGDIADAQIVLDVFSRFQPKTVVHLAAQAGVRYSIQEPRDYVSANVSGFLNILEACRDVDGSLEKSVEHLVYASSSSVYGKSATVPYSTHDRTDSPVSLYAATKKSNELFAYAYADLFGIPATGLRFFTVYGPMGRPDMAYFKFAEALLKREPIDIYNHGDMKRDFTYVDDVVAGVMAVMKSPPASESPGSVPHKIYNIGNSSPEDLMRFVEVLEGHLIDLGVIDGPGERRLLPMQPGDVYQTYADVAELTRDFGFAPSTSLEVGLRRFAEWFRQYRKERDDQGS